MTDYNPIDDSPPDPATPDPAPDTPARQDSPATDTAHPAGDDHARHNRDNEPPA